MNSINELLYEYNRFNAMVEQYGRKILEAEFQEFFRDYPAVIEICWAQFIPEQWDCDEPLFTMFGWEATFDIDELVLLGVPPAEVNASFRQFNRGIYEYGEGCPIRYLDNERRRKGAESRLSPSAVDLLNRYSALEETCRTLALAVLWPVFGYPRFIRANARGFDVAKYYPSDY